MQFTLDEPSPVSLPIQSIVMHVWSHFTVTILVLSSCAGSRLCELPWRRQTGLSYRWCSFASSIWPNVHISTFCPTFPFHPFPGIFVWGKFRFAWPALHSICSTPSSKLALFNEWWCWCVLSLVWWCPLGLWRRWTHRQWSGMTFAGLHVIQRCPWVWNLFLEKM